jgi:hypothetical protein
MSESCHDLAERNGGYWGEHKDYPACDWAYEVANNDTRLGYWAWVANKLEEEATIK